MASNITFTLSCEQGIQCSEERQIINIQSDNDTQSSDYSSGWSEEANHFFRLEEGFSLIVSKFYCAGEVVFSKEAADDNTIIICYELSADPIKYELEIDGLSVTKQILQNNVLTFSNALTLKILPLASSSMHHLWLVLTKDWLKEKTRLIMADNPDKINQLFALKKKFSLRKSLQAELSVVHNLLNYPFANTQETIAHFELKAAANELLADYIKKALAIKGTSADEKIVRPEIMKLREIKFYIRQNLLRGTPISLPELADKFSISEASLKRYFKKFANTTFSDFYNNERLKKAFDVISNEKHSTIQEIAHRLGYKNTSHFAKSFKEFYNFYPSEIRSRFSA
ncbi:helix-turn-helix transcriptional regulator [Pinibacter soli]|uniref:AraC family transcriptional regulator n=1 Tax=Pinibacter soli TaxID=3044211 RepID=A0ABT6RII7_9BACT|nr:AraC family transcriptional regulator [Pinibacter soli]MDI3322384.1 AraC family transcriptional regulator [Pinibacter soli]